MGSFQKRVHFLPLPKYYNSRDVSNKSSKSSGLVANAESERCMHEFTNCNHIRSDDMVVNDSYAFHSKIKLSISSAHGYKIIVTSLSNMN